MEAVLPDSIDLYMKRFVARRRRFDALRAAGIASGVFLAWVLAACIFDRIVAFPAGIRLLLLIIGTGIIFAVAGPALLRLFGGRTDWIQAAAQIEQCNPRFAQRLRTIVSQLHEPPGLRGSGDMLDELIQQVGRQMEKDHPGRWVSPVTVLAPWLVVAGLGAVVAGLCLIPTMGMPLLLQRFMRPFSGISAITTTRIVVEPGNAKLTPGRSIIIRAIARHLGGASLDLLTSGDGRTWTRIPMLPAGGGEFVYSMPPIERDLFYRVQGGDALTDNFRLRLLRPPAVLEYRLRHEYPSYTQRPELRASGTDGILEALIGTRVQLAIVSTVPLESAALTLRGARIDLSRGPEPTVFQTDLLIRENAPADLEMTSADGLVSRFPAALTIRAVPDRAPMVRLLQPADDLRLHPRDLVTLQYQAIDDYGLVNLDAVVQVNAEAATAIPLARRGDSRRQEGQVVLDLARFPLKIGDVVTVSVQGRDGAGARAASAARRILVSPRSIDLNTHQRIAELRQAALLAGQVQAELERSIELLAAARRTDGLEVEYLTLRTRASASMSNALEAGLLLNQSLLRACARSASSVQADALASCIDRARIQSFRCDSLVGQDGAGESEQALGEAIRPIVESARQLTADLRVLRDGELAAAIIADRANLASSSKPPADAAAAERWREVVRRAQQDVASSIQELNINPRSRDLDAQLQRRVDAAGQFARSCAPVDFSRAAVDWRMRLQRGETNALPLPDRLAAACAAEAVRPDGIAMIAQDWQLASRVAQRMALSASSGESSGAESWSEFPKLLSLLQREHVLRRAGIEKTADAAESREAANAARATLTQWAQAPNASGGKADSPAGDLAIAASALEEDHRYELAGQSDQNLVERASSQETLPDGAAQRIAEASQRIRRIDAASAQQEDVSQRTEALAPDQPEEAKTLSRDQQAVADTIHTIRPTDDLRASLMENEDSRRKATSAVQQVQETLAHYPQQLTAAHAAADAYRTALARLEEARVAARNAKGEEAIAAQRLVQQAVQTAREAQESLKQACESIAADTAQQMSVSLEPFLPETQQAVRALSERLAPALQVWRQSAEAADAAAIERAASGVRSALESAQNALQEAQDQIIQTDPLVAARWFAESAAQLLAASPPQINQARGRQKTVSLALNRAWQGALRDARAERLGVTAQYRPLVKDQAPPQDPGQAFLGELLPGLRQWGFLRTRHSDAGSPTETAPAGGYADALRLYFEALSKAQQGAARKGS